jgi:hypothetical protein
MYKNEATMYLIVFNIINSLQRMASKGESGGIWLKWKAFPHLVLVCPIWWDKVHCACIEGSGKGCSNRYLCINGVMALQNE